jgi:hypothetical protein
MNNQTYYIYNPTELANRLDNITEPNTDVYTFFENFTFGQIINQNSAKIDSSNVFKNVVKENPTRSRIIGHLNKLKRDNLLYIVNCLREIPIETDEELNDFVFQCIQKIKKENDTNRPIIAALCKELLDYYFMTVEGEKIYFRKLLINEVRNDYRKAMNFDSDDWTRDKAEKVMILIGVLYNNGQIIENFVIESIIGDFQKNIRYIETDSQEHYDHVEKSIHLMSHLISTVIINDDSITIFQELKKFLFEQLQIYEEKKCIPRKTRLTMTNIMLLLGDDKIKKITQNSNITNSNISESVDK